jgi:hypothetical protein
MHSLKPHPPNHCFWCLEPLCEECSDGLHGACCACVMKIRKIIATPKGGRPPKLKLCKCGVRLDARTRRQHERSGCGGAEDFVEVKTA